jgi:hypothetical protein
MKANTSKPVISKIAGAKDIVKYYKSSVSYSVRVFDGNSFAVGKLVKFTINKKVCNIRVDRSGFANLKLNQKPGKYTVIVEYNKIKVKNTITVKSTLITKDLKIKVKKTGKFTAKVLSSKGKPLAKKTVKIKFRGKTYKIKTSKKGIATFKVSKNLKAGKYTIKTAWNGLTNSNRITVKK